MRRTRAGLAALLLLTLALRAATAQEVGAIAAVEGSAEIGQAGAWRVVEVGVAVALHDELRTGRPGRLRIVFRDDTVLNVGDDSHVVIDEQVFDPAQGTYESLLRLLKGRIRALVSDYYQQPRARFHIETQTAVSGIRGTEFVMAYDTSAESTEVIGISGRVEVHSVLDRERRGVLITAREYTQVARGKFPTPPRRLDDTIFRQYLDGLEFIGLGEQESMTVGNPLVSGSAVPEQDQSIAFPAPAFAAEEAGAPVTGVDDQRDASSILQQPADVLRGIVDDEGDLGVRF